MAAVALMTLDLVTVSGVRGFMQLTSQAVSMTMQDSLKKKPGGIKQEIWLFTHACGSPLSVICMYAWS